MLTPQSSKLTPLDRRRSPKPSMECNAQDLMKATAMRNDMEVNKAVSAV
jgi:hypothetical protein